MSPAKVALESLQHSTVAPSVRLVAVAIASGITSTDDLARLCNMRLNEVVRARAEAAFHARPGRTAA